MHRFFFNNTHQENDKIRLDEAESKHALQVLRLKKGTAIVLLDGLGTVYEAEITDTGTKQAPIVTARVLKKLPDNEPRTRVTLYQGMPKGDKMETVLQKCTEIGVHAIQPVQFARSVKEVGKNPEKNLQRYRRIAQEAAKQCCRGQVPLVGQTKSFAEVLERMQGHGLILVPWEEAEGPHIRDALGGKLPAEIAIVIGPEGGITPEEIAQLKDIGARVVTLGPRILRTETAGMAALAGILTLTGDL